MFIESDLHELHIYCGWTILICSLIHGVAHVARWAAQGHLSLLHSHFSGITGMIIFLSMILICIPMTIFRKTIQYEIRKYLHYFFLVFALALCFHSPKSAIPNGGFAFYVFGSIIVWYLLDASYCTCFMTEKIETTKFDVLPNGVQMTMNVSKFFQRKGAQGGYCYICLPWVDKTQWHAFSLFENPTNPQQRQIFVQAGGDWTRKVHQYLQRDTVRPAWVQGPFPTPYLSAEDYDNQILVASGIGITPALSVIRAHKESRRTNLIWAVRDIHLLEFFLRHLYLDHDGWNLIFYTGKDPLPPCLEVFANTNVCIILGRPNLRDLIPSIIYGIESGKGLPEQYCQRRRRCTAKYLAQTLASDDDATLDSQYVRKAAGRKGFCIQDTAGLRAKKRISLDEQDESTENSLLERLEGSFHPWKPHPEAKNFLRSLKAKNNVLPTWAMLYCGGAQVLEKELHWIADKYGIDLHMESFGW